MRDARPVYLQDQVSALAGRRKVIVRGEDLLHYDLARDPDESAPQSGAIEDFAALAQAEGASAASVADAIRHLRAFRARRQSVGLAA